jgi:methylmalonyl-CoA mutase N-terminal domain/subunit
VQDPSAGSYYIEQLTNQIAEKVWQRFQEKV